MGIVTIVNIGAGDALAMRPGWGGPHELERHARDRRLPRRRAHRHARV